MDRKVFDALKWFFLNTAFDEEETPSIDLSASVVINSAPDILSSFSSDTTPYHQQTERLFVDSLRKKTPLVNVSPIDRASTVISIGSRSREQNYLFLAQAQALLQENGKVVFVLENDLGAKSLVKTLRKLSPDITYYSKKHCQIILIEQGAQLSRLQSLYAPYQDSPLLTKGDLRTAPGIFAWDKIDKGTELLISRCSNLELCGEGLDIGCGAGIIGLELLKQPQHSLTTMSFLDSERLAIDAARENIAQHGLSSQSTFVWEDFFTFIAQKKCYDCIVSNLPFHQNAKTDRSLPRRIVELVPKILRKNGIAILLWHSQPPNFSDEQWRNFSQVECTFESSPYWIIQAKR